MDDEDNSVTMVDVLKEQEAFEEDAKAVLGASDDKNCTYGLGYVKRQALYACLTCCSDSTSDPESRAGVCLACSLACHENHNLVELYTKRNFRCDCAGPKFQNNCSFNSKKSEQNIQNVYNQNFSGLYCTCHRPYPDADDTIEDEMIQCIVCEDWFHSRHLNVHLPPMGQYSEMICEECTNKNEFLQTYLCYEVNSNIHIEQTSEKNNVDVETNIEESIATHKNETAVDNDVENIKQDVENAQTISANQLDTNECNKPVMEDAVIASAESVDNNESNKTSTESEQTSTFEPMDTNERNELSTEGEQATNAEPLDTIDNNKLNTESEQTTIAKPIDANESYQLSAESEQATTAEPMDVVENNQLSTESEQTITAEPVDVNESNQLSTESEQTTTAELMDANDSNQLSTESEQTITAEPVDVNESNQLSTESEQTTTAEPMDANDSNQLSTECEQTITDEPVDVNESNQLSTESEQTTTAEPMDANDSNQISTECEQTITDGPVDVNESNQLSTESEQATTAEPMDANESNQLSTECEQTITAESVDVNESNQLSIKSQNDPTLDPMVVNESTKPSAENEHVTSADLTDANERNKHNSKDEQALTAEPMEDNENHIQTSEHPINSSHDNNSTNINEESALKNVDDCEIKDIVEESQKDIVESDINNERGQQILDLLSDKQDSENSNFKKLNDEVVPTNNESADALSSITEDQKKSDDIIAGDDSLINSMFSEKELNNTEFITNQDANNCDNNVQEDGCSENEKQTSMLPADLFEEINSVIEPTEQEKDEINDEITSFLTTEGKNIADVPKDLEKNETINDNLREADTETQSNIVHNDVNSTNVTENASPAEKVGDKEITDNIIQNNAVELKEQQIENMESGQCSENTNIERNCEIENVGESSEQSIVDINNSYANNEMSSNAPNIEKMDTCQTDINPQDSDENKSSIQGTSELPNIHDSDKISSIESINSDQGHVETVKNNASIENNQVENQVISDKCENENGDKVNNEAKKRKPSDDHTNGMDSPIRKKIKQEIVYISQCIKPAFDIKYKKPTGATFWPSDWRTKLCSCKCCVDEYSDKNVLFLLDLEDTVSAYEDLGKIKSEPSSSQYEKGMEALSSLGHVQQINAITEYNKMKEKLLDFLKTFKDKKEVVKEEDIKGFFAGMKPKREPDGVYFCR